MRVLILGGDGMLGHRLLMELARDHDVKVTLRRSLPDYASHGIFNPANTLSNVNALDTQRLKAVVQETAPEVVINAIGLVKQRRTSQDTAECIEVNALLPHKLAAICGDAGCRLIHISTDCVFSGKSGNYKEDDLTDATDTYGRTKLLGEVSGPHCVTLRTSLIGLELARKQSLIEWYLAQKGSIRGFTKAVFSGFTTLEFSRILRLLVEQFAELQGVYHVASDPISKFDLLTGLAVRLQRDDVQIEPDRDFHCDRSLCGERFTAETGYRSPVWNAMLDELATAIKQR